jgi:hypothetical protein
MKIKIIGQARGGNAVQWFDLFNNNLNEFNDISKILYICRNECELDATFPIIRLYGRKVGWWGKLYKPFINKVGLKYIIQYLSRKYSYDVIHIQGNYHPGYNRKIIKNTSEKVVLNLYGSDYYQNWSGNKHIKKYRDDFIDVCESASAITCNWITTKNDFVKEFPHFKNKTHSIPGGVDSKWFGSNSFKKSKNKTIFLSTRALYPYNNVELLIKAFCNVFKNDISKELIILSGYGSSKLQISNAVNIVKDNNMEASVKFIFDWIDDDQLLEIYEKADYNFCLGDTDQLTISIIYGILKNVTNVLSPLQSYYDFKNQGYASPIILDEISELSLEKFLLNLPETNIEKLTEDESRARGDYNFRNNYERYISLYKSIITK